MSNYEAWRISFQSSEQAARAAYEQLIEERELLSERCDAAYYRGQDDARNGIHEVWQYEAFTADELPEFESKPLCRIKYWSDSGDMSVGIYPSSGIELAADQSGTILESLLAANKRLEEAEKQQLGHELSLKIIASGVEKAQRIEELERAISQKDEAIAIRIRREAELERKLAEQNEPSMQEFNEFGGAEEMDAIEQLRFFCSLAMNNRDWLDVEKFFAAVQRQLAQAREEGRKEAVPDKAEMVDLINEHIGDAYFCTRVWSAWGVGTMSEDDFSLVSESGNPEELADAVIAMLSASPSPTRLNAKEGGE